MWGASGGGGGGGDPFFNPNAMHSHMHNQMRAMDSMMNDMMGGGFMDPFGDARQSRHHMLTQQPHGFGGDPRSQMMNPRQQDPLGGMMMPFGGGLGGLFGGMMTNMHRMASMDPHEMVDASPEGGHVYSQSTIINFNAAGEPQVVHKTREARKIGNAKETRTTHRDTVTGEESMTIGHHVGDRAHIIEKRRVSKDKEIEKSERFVNMHKDHARDFESDFASAARAQSSSNHGAHSNMNHRRALPPLPHERRYSSRPTGGGPIIEELPADSHHHRESPQTRRPFSGATRRRYQQEEPNGPIVEEPDDDEPVGSGGKRGRSNKLWQA